MNPTYTNLGVVVVTFHPEGDVEGRLELMAAQARMLVVVDNDSGEEIRGRLREICARREWDFLANPENLGLGIALNQGVRRLAGRGVEWVLFFDQDSSPMAGMSARMIETWGRHADRERVAIVGANFRDAATGRRHRFLRRHPRVPGWFEKVEAEWADLPEVTMVITSGSMVRVTDFEVLGGLAEDFFIDYLDTDFCLRCLERGRLIAVSTEAGFDHALGDRSSRRWWGMDVQPTNHGVLRHYYIARNRVSMWRRHAWRMPHWAMFDLAAAGLWVLRVVMAESEKYKKMKAMAVGTWDGVRGRAGRCAEMRERGLKS